MENQRPETGDLSDDAGVADAPEVTDAAQRTPRGKAARRSVASTDSGTVAAEPEASGEQGDAGGPADPEASGERGDAGRPADPGASSDLEEAAPTVDSDTESPDLAPTAVRRPGRVAVVALVAAAVLFVGFAAFAGAALQPVLADRAATATKLEIARTASGAITTLWTYTPENMDQLGDRAAGYLGGDFATEYRKYIDAIVPTNKQAQVSNSTEVVGAAVESLSATEATAIVYTNSTSTSPLSKNIPSLRYLSWRLTLHRDGTRWLVTGMAPVTSLDLTPQI